MQGSLEGMLSPKGDAKVEVFDEVSGEKNSPRCYKKNDYTREQKCLKIALFIHGFCGIF